MGIGAHSAIRKSVVCVRSQQQACDWFSCDTSQSQACCCRRTHTTHFLIALRALSENWLQLVTQGITEKVSPWQQLQPGEAGEELGVTFTAQPRLGDGQGGQPRQLGQQGNTLNIAMHCEHIL